LCQELRRRWLADNRKPFFASHRQLAESLGCSAGNLTPLMDRAVADGILMRRRAGRTFRLVVIDQGTNPFAARQSADSITAPAAASAPAVPEMIADPLVEEAVASATGRQEPELIVSESAHVEDHDSDRVVGDARMREKTEQDARRLTARGFFPQSVPHLLASQQPVEHILALLDQKERERARNPHGVVVAWVRSGVRIGEIAQQEASGGTGGQNARRSGGDAGHGRHPGGHGTGRRAAGGRSSPPPRTPIAQPPIDVAAFRARPRIRLQF
jgi:hypothetical protein